MPKDHEQFKALIVWLPPETKTRFVAAVKGQGDTIKSVMMDYIEAYLHEYEREEAPRKA